MKARIVPIGNSLGIRIPQALLKLCNIKEEVDLVLKRNAIVIKPALRRPRDGWEESLKLMHENKDDHLLIDDSLDLHMENWEW